MCRSESAMSQMARICLVFYGNSARRSSYIRPRPPRLNGNVERSHRVDDREFSQLLDKDGISDDIHLFNEKLREWEDYYNYHRPHGGLVRPRTGDSWQGQELRCHPQE